MHKFLMLLVVVGLSGPAAAYIGPGLGLGGLAALVGVVISVLVALFALFWYPLKRMLAKLRGRKGEE